LDWSALGERVLALAGQLVAVPSGHGTAGEAQVIDLLAGHLRAGLSAALAAGRAELQLLDVERPARDGSGPGKALLAWLAPPPGQTSTTALALLGHCDTVAESPGTARRAEDGHADWNHGRGWLDMKGGVAAISELLLAQAQAPSAEAVPAHLLLLLTTDEEDASRGSYALLPAVQDLLARRGLTLAGVINADYCEPRSADPQRGLLCAGTTGKLLLGISVFGQPAHACAPGAGVNAGALAAHIAAGLEGLPRLSLQVGTQRLPPPRVLHLTDARPAYDVTTPDQAQLYVNLLHAGAELEWLWTRCLRTVRELARDYALQQRRRALAWARKGRAADLPPAAARPVVLDYAALVKAARAAGSVAEPPPLAPTDEPREAALAHVARLVASWREAAGTGHLQERPLIVLSLLPPFYPGGRLAADSPLASALTAAARTHGASVVPLYPNIADASAFCWTPANAVLAGQAPCFPPEVERQAWAALATPVCDIGPLGYGAHGPDERVYLPYLRDDLPRLIWDVLRAAAGAGQPQA
jgi:arginine utilization protein RocB